MNRCHRLRRLCYDKNTRKKGLSSIPLFSWEAIILSFARTLMVIRINCCYDKIMRRLFDLHLKAPPPNDPQGAPWAWIQPFDYHSRGSISVKPRGTFQNLVLKMFSSKNWYKVSFFGKNGKYGTLGVPLDSLVTKTEACQLYEKSKLSMPYS